MLLWRSRREEGQEWQARARSNMPAHACSPGVVCGDWVVPGPARAPGWGGLYCSQGSTPRYLARAPARAVQLCSWHWAPLTLHWAPLAHACRTLPQRGQAWASPIHCLCCGRTPLPQKSEQKGAAVQQQCSSTKQQPERCTLRHTTSHCSQSRRWLLASIPPTRQSGRSRPRRASWVSAHFPRHFCKWQTANGKWQMLTGGHLSPSLFPSYQDSHRF